MKSKLALLILAILLGLGFLLLKPKPVAAPTHPAENVAASASPTSTFTPEPASEAEDIPEEATPTFTPTPDAALSEVEVCVELLEPLDGSEFPGNARVTFSWSAHPDAETYSLNFIFPDGLELTFTTDETTLNRYMDGFSMHPAYNQSGEHQWYVSALNAAGDKLCQSDFFTFTKGLSDGVGEESAPQGNGDSGNECTVDCTPPDGGGTD